MSRHIFPKPSNSVEQRNFSLNLVEGVLFLSGASFVSVQTVLPALVARLGGSNLAIGYLGVVAWVGLFLPQILAARHTEVLQWKKPWAIQWAIVHRAAIICIIFSLLLFGEADTGLALILFLVFFTMSQILLGITTPGWFEMYAKMTPVRVRGRLTGLRNSIGGVIALGCGVVLTWVLGSFQFPLSYALAFSFAVTLQIVALIVQTRLVEEYPSVVGIRKPVSDFLGQVPDLLKKNTEFRRFLFASAIQIMATIPVAFFTVYAMSEFGARGSVIGEFTVSIVAVQIVSGLVYGYVADRFGNKAALVIAAVAMLFATATAILAPTLEWFRLVFVFLGISLGTDMMARYNISIEYGPDNQRSRYIGITNTLLAPFYLVGLVGGVVSDGFGYHAVFFIGLVFSVLALVSLLYFVKEPRNFIQRVSGI